MHVLTFNLSEPVEDGGKPNREAHELRRRRPATRDQFSVGKPFFGLLRKRKISGFLIFFRIFRSKNDLKFKFQFSTFSDRISVFSDRKMLLVIENCKISEEKLKILQHFV